MDKPLILVWIINSIYDLHLILTVLKFKPAHQTEAQTGVPHKANIIAVFDHLDVRKFFVKIIGSRYPKDTINLDYTKDDYLNHYRHLEAFSPEHVKEPILIPFKNFTDMKNFYPIQFIDLWFQIDHISPKKFIYSRNIESQQIMLDNSL